MLRVKLVMSCHVLPQCVIAVAADDGEAGAQGQKALCQGYAVLINSFFPLESFAMMAMMACCQPISTIRDIV